MEKKPKIFLQNKLKKLNEDQKICFSDITKIEEQIKRNDVKVTNISNESLYLSIRKLKKKTYSNIEAICKLEEEIYYLNKQKK